MRTERTHNPMLWSAIAIALLVALTAVAGISWPATYARETLYQKAGGIGSDLVDLLLVAPVLLISGIKGYRGSVPARLVWVGTLGYLVYDFALYVFGVHFNALFLVYCATLSLCLYAGVFSMPFIPLEQIAQMYSPRSPRKTVAIVKKGPNEPFASPKRGFFRISNENSCHPQNCPSVSPDLGFS